MGRLTRVYEENWVASGALGFITARWRSVCCAVVGVRYVVRSQRNAWVHAAATVGVVMVGGCLRLSAGEWCWMIAAMAGVWAAEAMNTALELLCDAACPEFHPMETTLANFPSALADSEAAAECSMLEWALGRFGLRCIVIIGHDRSSTDNHIPADYILHLVQSVPVQWLRQAITELCGRKGARAVMMTADVPRSRSYRELLQLGDDSQVLRIRRDFRRGNQGIRRSTLIGIACHARELAAIPTGHCWQTARTLLRQSQVRIRPFNEFTREQRGYFIGPEQRPRPIYNACKRTFDILFSLAAIAATFPICLAVAAIIKAYDRGPIFFVHKRESIHGRPFGCIKFRTMVRNADALQKQLRKANLVDGPQFKLAFDPRVTPFGRFLRKSNIDELPQFLNVLLGHMSVVGPRPSPFEENQLCPAWREARLSVRPGITGLWQVSRSPERGAADFQEWILYDTQYVERRNSWLDLKIVLLTIKELFGKGQ